MSSKSSVFLFSLLSLWAAVACADPPARVGRISYLEGNVSFLADAAHSDNENDARWVGAQLNYPLLEGAALFADDDARFELQLGPATVSADGETDIDIPQFDDDNTAVRVDRGAVNVQLQTLNGNHFVVVTPYGDAEFSKPGSYHIEVDAAAENQPARVQITTLAGEANIETPRGAINILPGERAVIDGDPVTVDLVEGNATEIDAWARMRERKRESEAAARYVSPDMTGYEDLDSAGRWAVEPEYGAVWYPVVAAGWAPYRYGHWEYIEPWGWTWIDDAAWGFAPFHYGRWVRAHGAWGWCPGERIARPVFAPALVAFVGGDNWRVGVSAGHRPIGWVPLAPREIYRPYYPASANYIRHINVNYVDKTVINKITINNPHTINNVRAENLRNRDAMTVVSHEAFAQAHSIHDRMIKVSRDEMTRARSLQNLNRIQPETMHRAPQPDQIRDDSARTRPISRSPDSRRYDNESQRPVPTARIPVMQPNPREINSAREREFENKRAPAQMEMQDRVAPQPTFQGRERMERDRMEREREEGRGARALPQRDTRMPVPQRAPAQYEQNRPIHVAPHSAPQQSQQPQQYRPTPQQWQRSDRTQNERRSEPQHNREQRRDNDHQ